MIPADAMELRPMESGDLPEVLAMAHGQGRNVHREEYARFLALEGARGFVLRQNGTLQGAITAIQYFEQGFLGPVLIPPGADGLAIALLAHAIEGLQLGGAGLLEAESTGEEAAILSRMGFSHARSTLVLEREPRGAIEARDHSSLLAPGDFLDLGALDGAAFGIGRKEYLYALMQDFPDGGRVLREGDDVRGYAFLRRSRRGYHLGPMVTREGDLEAARALLADAVRLGAGWPLVVLAPEGSGLLPDLGSHGFREVGRLTRMRAGSPGRIVEGAARATEWLVGSRMTG